MLDLSLLRSPFGGINLRAIPAPEPAVPYKLTTGDKIRPFQMRAAHKLFTGTPPRCNLSGRYMTESPIRSGTAIHIDMGLGKTVIGLTAIADWFRFLVISRPVLVIAPIKVCETVWRQEAKEWSHTQHLTFSLLRGTARDRAFALNRKAHVYLINPEGLKWLFEYLRKDWSFFDAVVIDESSMFKDNRSQRFRVLSNYGTQMKVRGEDGKVVYDAEGKPTVIPPYQFKRSGILTGTPAPSSYLNLWAPFYLIDHGERLNKKFDTYQNRFFHQTAEVADHVFKFDLNAEEAESRPQWQAREGAPERIHELVADITVELNAEDYGILPQTIGDASKGEPPTTHLHRVELPKELRGKYDALEKDAVLELSKDVLMAQNGGAKSMMCWQIANGAIYGTDDFGRKEVHDLHTAKLDALIDLIERIDSNVIVPYYFQHDFARIVARLQKEGIPFSSLRGRHTERTVDDWNAGRIPVLLLHPQSAAHGLNLQFGGHHLIWYTMLWSLERYLQTNARLARSGQKGIVGIHHIVTTNTTDELMLINLRQNGDDQHRFRSALREYQQLRGLGLYEASPLGGLDI